MRKLTFFLCAVFLTMIGSAHGSHPFAMYESAGANESGTFSSYQGLSWSSNGQLYWTGASANRILAGPGDTCNDPAVISSLPFTVTDDTSNYGDDYSSGDMPPLAPGAVGSPGSNYLGGDDVVYAYTPSENGVINISVSNHASWTGLFVFTGCPFSSTVGGHTSSSATTVLTVNGLTVNAGVTYYIVISTWPSPQSTSYTLTVEADVFDCPELEANIGDPCDDGDPNTVGDTINGNCECEGTVPGLGASCEVAIAVDCNAEPVTFNSIGSTATNTSSCSMGNSGLWFTFTGTGNTVTINSTAGFDHEMSIMTGSCGSLSTIGCKDGSTAAETFTLNSTVSGQPYYVYIAHYSSGNTTTGNISISLVCATEFDCPDLQANIGDSCDLGGGETGVINASCECEEVSCQNATRYPSAVITPDPTGAPTTISTCNYWSEYSEIGGIIAGNDYQFDSVKSGVSAYVTVREGSVDGPVVGKGYGPLTITAPSSANLFVHWTADDACTTSSGCATSTVSCVSCANEPDCEGVPGGPAQPGTPCDDGDPNTLNDVYDENCNCAGVVPSEGDSCSMAIDIECGAEPVTYSTANSVATNTTSCSMGSNGIWFAFEGTGADITVNSSATFDHEMSINTGSCEELVNIACKDSSIGAESYTISATVAGQMYYVYIAHYSATGTATGDITISLDCATVPECTAPGIEAYAADEVGEPLDGCVEAGGSFYVYVQLNGGEGNDSYYVSANGGDPLIVDADGAVNLGPFTVGTNVNVNAVGVDDPDCGASASVSSPAVCPPSNDDCGSATALACGQPVSGTTTGATASGLPTTCNGYTSSSGIDVFYTFEADGSSSYTVSLDAAAGNSFDGVLFVYSGACGELVSMGCSDSGNPETITLDAPDAGTYTVRVFRYSGTGNFTLGLECSAAPECVAPELTLTAQDANGGAIDCLEAGGEYYVLATLSGGSGNTSYYVAANDFDAVEVPAGGSTVFGPIAAGTNVNASALGVQDDDCVAYATLDSPGVCPPSNDDCGSATALACGQPISGTTTGATASGLPTTCNGYTSSSGIDVFYTFEADGSSSYTVSLDAAEGNFFDGVLFVYSGACGELVSMGCSDSGNPETITLDAPDAGTYTVRVFRYSGTGNFTLGLECSSAPECVAPELTLTAQDANGGAIDCLEAGGEYYVLATLSGGSGNTSYYVSLNDSDAVEVPADSSQVFGPYSAGTFINASALGVQDQDCVTYATLESPAFCPPSNDDCESAIALECNAEPMTYSSVGSTATAPAGCTLGSNGIWFSFMGTGADITINSTASFDHEMSINTGSCGELVNIGCKDSSTGAESYTVEASVADQMYYVYVAHWSGSSSTTGTITIAIECATVPECTAPELTLTAQDANGGSIDCLEAGGEYYVLATLSGGSGNTSYYVSLNDSDAVEVPADSSYVFGPYSAGTNINASALGVQDQDCVAYATLDSPAICPPSNDDCGSATALACGQTIYGTTTGATASGLPTTCNGYTSSSGIDVFYSFEADGSSSYTVSLDAAAGNFFDGVLFVYSGACGELVSMGCSDSGNPETITLDAPAAGTYTVRVFRYSGTGDFTLDLECTPGGGGTCDPSTAFVTTWRTSASNQSITIPTYAGETYDYTVEWGDGTSSTNLTGDATHVYDDPGTYTVSICGTFPRIFFNIFAADRLKIRSIEQWGTNVWTSMNGAFAGAENLVSNATDMPNLSMVTDMTGMFAYARAFNGDMNMPNWDVSNVTNMYGMFGGASVFNQPIGNWDVSNVQDMREMFNGATFFNQDLSGWDVGSVENMEKMFRTALHFNQPIGNWDVSNVQNMNYMFSYAIRFDQDLGNWDVSNVSAFKQFLQGVALSTANYDSLLIGWSGRPLMPNVRFGGGLSKYCAGQAARQYIINTYNWIIVDGGMDCSGPLRGDANGDVSNTLSTVTLYPNPMNTYVTLDNSENLKLVEANIYDLSGRLVKTVDLHGMSAKIDINVSNLSSATYMIVISGENGGKISRLLIKE